LKITGIQPLSNETAPKENQNKNVQYQFGEFTLDIVRGSVLKAGEEIKLRPKVYEALKYLVEHPGQLIGKQELMQAVWPDSFVTDDSLVS
jgi:DNA-binding winged helix-turn-helix (wHTH) protein